MADKTTFIKLDRNIIAWRWFTTPKILSVFIWLLVKANVKEGHFKTDTINRGSLVTSNAHIAEGCGITIDNARTALANLESTGEISREVRNHYQIITINNYESYQSAIPKTGYQIPSNPDSKSQANPKQIPTIKEYKNNNNGKNGKKEEFAPQTFPCGAKKKPNWMDDEMWEKIMFRTTENIPGVEQGFYDTYIEYAEEMLKQGRDIK